MAEASATTSTAWKVNEEALKCAINSVSSRPDFVTHHLLKTARLTRVLALAKVCRHDCGVAGLSSHRSRLTVEASCYNQRPGPASFHLLVWKLLLVACEAPDTVAALCGSQETWELVFSVRMGGPLPFVTPSPSHPLILVRALQTLYFSIYGGGILKLAVDCDRSTLVLDLLKLLTVLASGMEWTTQAEDVHSGIYGIVRKFVSRSSRQVVVWWQERRRSCCPHSRLFRLVLLAERVNCSSVFSASRLPSCRHWTPSSSISRTERLKCCCLSRRGCSQRSSVARMLHSLEEVAHATANYRFCRLSWRISGLCCSRRASRRLGTLPIDQRTLLASSVSLSPTTLSFSLTFIGSL